MNPPLPPPRTPALRQDGISDADLHRAEVLVEALPYITRFAGQTMVIKLGGSAIDSAEVTSILQDVVLLRSVGMRVALVHGGGPEITAWQRRVGLTPRFVDGQRVTDRATMELVRMVLTGSVGPKLVAQLHALGGRAIGLSGEDGPILIARPRQAPPSEPLGFVGDVSKVNTAALDVVLESGHTPVIASIGLGRDGEPYNINADAVAAEIAVALHASKLILLTDVAGVCDRDGTVIPEINPGEVGRLLAAGVATGGMVPKLQAALRALEAVPRVHVIDGRAPHALLLEVLTNSGIGTMIAAGPTNRLST